MASLKTGHYIVKFSTPSNAVESFLDFFYGIAKDYRAAVGAAHGAIGFCEGGEEPFHFGLVERHVDFDGGVARGGGGDFGLQRFDGDGGIFALDAVENFREQFFRVAAGDAGRSGLNRYAARAHGLDFETVGAELFGDFFVDDQLARGQLENHGHEHALAFDSSGAAGFEVLLKQDAFVSDMLVDKPEAFAVDGDDKAGADLAEGFQICDLVGARERRGGIAVGPGEIRGPVWCGRFSGEAWRACLRRQAEGCTRFECEALLDGLQRRGAEIETAVGAYAGTEADLFHGGNDGAGDDRGSSWIERRSGRERCASGVRVLRRDAGGCGGGETGDGERAH